MDNLYWRGSMAEIGDLHLQAQGVMFKVLATWNS